jgi:serine/threonine protein phosphatase PrpC
MGNRASKFVARHLQSLFHILASDATRDQKDFSGGVQHIKFQSIAASKLWLSAFGIDDANDDNTGKLNVQENLFENASLSSDIWKLTTVVNALHMSFVETNRFFERNHGLYPNDLHTGTTATVVLLFPTAIVVGHVGDSRAVICCDRHTDTGRLIALQLTVDHTPYNAVERSRIEALGGQVVNTGEKLRVNGAMAVTRSIGDFPFGSLLTPEPDIVVFHRYDTKRQPKNQSNSLNGDGSGQLDPCEMLYTMRTRWDGSISGDMHAVTQQFMVLASDGLFDVMSNDEVVRFVCASIVDIMKDSPTSKVEVDTVMIDESDAGAHEHVLPFNAFHIAAEQLAQEAYLRGSSDNIGVCIINLFEER